MDGLMRQSSVMVVSVRPLVKQLLLPILLPPPRCCPSHPPHPGLAGTAALAALAALAGAVAVLARVQQCDGGERPSPCGLVDLPRRPSRQPRRPSRSLASLTPASTTAEASAACASSCCFLWAFFSARFLAAAAATAAFCDAAAHPPPRCCPSSAPRSCCYCCYCCSRWLLSLVPSPSLLAFENVDPSRCHAQFLVYFLSHPCDGMSSARRLGLGLGLLSSCFFGRSVFRLLPSPPPPSLPLPLPLVLSPACSL